MLAHVKNLIGKRSVIRLTWHRAKALFAALYYGFPARRLTVIGITGTDGKTTTVGMTAHILNAADIKTGALSTAFFQIGDHIEWNATQKTSPSPFIVQKFLRDLVRARCTHVVLECSSHGLVQGRTLFTWPKVAAVTNTTLEHLDYHGTMEQYRRDKGMLFQMLRGYGTKILNRDDASFALYDAIPSSRTLTYSKEAPMAGSDCMNLSDVSISPEGSRSVLHTGTEKISLELSIPGSFNLENALCAIGCAGGVGVAAGKAADALRSFKGVPGRMERIDAGQPFAVFVDFTVTPVAYEKTLKALRAMIEPGKRILVLTGSCGDRMREKRPIVGKICSELADVVVVTNEDPYTEDPQKIIDEVWAGVDQSQTEAQQIFDRGEAIRFIFSKAKPGDIVILCAKGSDTTMWTAEGQVPWNEREIARKMLRSM